VSDVGQVGILRGGWQPPLSPYSRERAAVNRGHPAPLAQALPPAKFSHAREGSVARKSAAPLWRRNLPSRLCGIRHIMACMIRRILVTALAADPTGTWTGDQPGPGGNTYNITFKLKADGGKLTGTMGGEQFEQPIQNGEIHGDDISFTVHLDFGDGIDLKYTGKVAADKIDFKVQRSGDDNAQPFVAKKTQ
jgi:hypothetical protein